MRRVSNGNKAAMLAAKADMKAMGMVMFNLDTTEKVVLNDIVEGKQVECEFD